MKREFEKAKSFTSFSEALINGIKTRYEKGEQSILFLNRRGYHTTMMCLGCRETIKCNHCDIAMTFHKGDNILACHLCGYSHSPPPRQCPKCKCDEPMKFKGVGTELIEKNLQALLPGVRTLRVDADTTRHKGSHQKLLKAFGSGKADVLIGTQMIAKGLHFPSVTLVGVINCDATLNIPDFRASETVFQLITQVAGRAGRGEMLGEVILQTHLPDNSTIQLAAQADFEKFFEEEIEVRKLFNYPPFINLIKISFSGLDQNKTLKFAEYFKHRLMQHLYQNFEWHPVLPAGHAKVKDTYRFQFLMRGNSVYCFQKALEEIKKDLTIPKEIKLKIDINPSSTF
jgi:primosomal protein N' (replication factor Y)